MPDEEEELTLVQKITNIKNALRYSGTENTDITSNVRVKLSDMDFSQGESDYWYRYSTNFRSLYVQKYWIYDYSYGASIRQYKNGMTVEKGTIEYEYTIYNENNRLVQQTKHSNYTSIALPKIIRINSGIELCLYFDMSSVIYTDASENIRDNYTSQKNYLVQFGEAFCIYEDNNNIVFTNKNILDADYNDLETRSVSLHTYPYGTIVGFYLYANIGSENTTMSVYSVSGNLIDTVSLDEGYKDVDLQYSKFLICCAMHENTHYETTKEYFHRPCTSIHFYSCVPYANGFCPEMSYLKINGIERGTPVSFGSNHLSHNIYNYYSTNDLYSANMKIGTEKKFNGGVSVINDIVESITCDIRLDETKITEVEEKNLYIFETSNISLRYTVVTEGVSKWILKHKETEEIAWRPVGAGEKAKIYIYFSRSTEESPGKIYPVTPGLQSKINNVYVKINNIETFNCDTSSQAIYDTTTINSPFSSITLFKGFNGYVSQVEIKDFRYCSGSTENGKIICFPAYLNSNNGLNSQNLNISCLACERVYGGSSTLKVGTAIKKKFQKEHAKYISVKSRVERIIKNLSYRIGAEESTLTDVATLFKNKPVINPKKTYPDTNFEGYYITGLNHIRIQGIMSEGKKIISFETDSTDALYNVALKILGVTNSGIGINIINRITKNPEVPVYNIVNYLDASDYGLPPEVPYIPEELGEYDELYKVATEGAVSIYGIDFSDLHFNIPHPEKVRFELIRVANEEATGFENRLSIFFDNENLLSKLHTKFFKGPDYFLLADGITPENWVGIETGYSVKLSSINQLEE